MSLTDVISTNAHAVAAALRRPPAAISILPTIPEIQPGELWVVEVPTETLPSARLRHILDRANVVIYDPTLADTVAASLPLGTYAERAPNSEGTDDRAAARAARFASDGWSVVRLVPARPTQRERLARVRRLVDELTPTRPASDVTVTVYEDGDAELSAPTETHLSRLDLVMVTYPRDARLTIVIDPPATGVAASGPRLYAVAGNGLAG
jgi:hypothetical protein